MKILVVDDSGAMRRILKNVLSKIGYTDVDEAADGFEGLSAVKANPPELILLDWNMPQLDGMGFIKMFRQSDKDTPVIMVTTEAEKARVVEAIKAGVNNYVVKPFEPDVLLQKIKETLDARAA